MDELIGRDAELLAVEQLLNRARDGLAALLIEGEPGIGKTTLWVAAQDAARARGYTVLTARPAQSEMTIPLGVFGDLFTGIDERFIDALPAPQREAIRVALLLAEPESAQSTQRALPVATASLLRHLTQGTQPLLIAIDDAQWMDKSSSAALSFALRRTSANPIAIVITQRAASPQPTPFGLDQVDADVERCMLGALSLAALHRLLSDRLATSFARTTLVKVESASRGNPFYALEIARALLRSQQPVKAGQPLPIPDVLAGLTAERVAALPSGTRDALLAAAVAFEPTVDDLSQVWGGALLRDIDPAVRDGIVRVEDGSVRFNHPLLAAAVLSRAEPARIREVHAALARIVKSSESKARHLGMAADGFDEEAAAALEAAGEQARLRGAPLTAAEMLERARDLTPPDRVDHAVRRAYLAARCYADSGERVQAATLLEALSHELAGGVARARVLQLLGQVRWSTSFPEALASGLDALRESTPDPALAAEIELDIVFCSLSLGDLAGAEMHARAAAGAADSVGSDGLRASSLAILGILDFFAGRGVSEALMQRALALEDPHRVGPTQMRPVVIHALVLLFTGRIDESAENLRALRDDAAMRGQEGAIPMMSFYLTWALMWRGRLAESAGIAEQARDVALLGDDASLLALALAATALAAAAVGDEHQARRDAQQSLALMQRIQWTLGMIWPMWALGGLEVSLGNAAAVHAILGPLAETVIGLGDVDPILGVFLPDEIEALAAAGDVHTAARYTDWLDAGAARLQRGWAIAAACRCRGLIAAATGDLTTARDTLDTAVQRYRELEMPVELARTLLAKGQVHRRGREKRLAAEALQEAVAIFDRAGARLWSDRARTELARVGLRPHAPTELTETERRIAELAASGLTNREVASAAFVSPKTVDNVLGRVYQKLGIASRAQLGVILARESEVTANP